MKQKLKNKMMSFLKRAFLAVAVLMTAMGIGTSCSKDMNPVGMGNGQAIGFSVYTAKPVTKGATFDLPYLFGYWDENSSTYVPGTGIGVFAFYQKAKSNGYAVDFNKYTGEPTYMYNQKVERTSSDGLNYCFNYSPVKYWPNNANDQISFFAYGPYDETFAWEDLQLETNLKGTKVTRHYIMEDLVEDQTDFLWANPVMNKKNTDVGGAVQFDFRHICSRIGVTCQINIDDDNSYVTIDKVVIRAKFNTSGDIVYLPSTNTAEWQYLERSYHTKDYIVYRAASPTDHRVRETVTTVGGEGTYMFPFPGTQDITVTATITQNNTVNVGGTPEVRRFTGEISQTFTDFELEEGKAYNFLLGITINPIDIGVVTVITWSENEDHIIP